jgi:hypothetical protein
MEFTTHLRLQSQATRLDESASCSHALRAPYGILTLYDTVFQQIYAQGVADAASLDYNSARTRHADFRLELFPLHSPLLGESWLVSFPPLNYMLKFSG